MKIKYQGGVIGKKSNIKYSVVLKFGTSSIIVIGDYFTLFSGSKLNPLSKNLQSCLQVNDGAKLLIGNNVGISSSTIWVHKSVSIGNNVTIGANSTIIDSDCHSLNYKDRGTAKDMLCKIDEPILIEDDVLIGMQSIILKGVTIGARSVIGAGSVVTKNIPSDVIAAGNPCRVIKNIES